MKNYKFNPQILRQYDIRGTVGDNLNENDAYYLGRSLAIMLHRKNLPLKACIARDGRISSPALSAKLKQGLLDSGIDVTDIGLTPTPALYFAAFELNDIGVAVVVTGSHNPKDQNGFKILLDKKPLFGEQIQALGQIAEEGNWVQGSGKLETVDIRARYVSRLAIGHKFTNADIKVAWDPGNGASAEVVKKLIARLPGEHIIINGEIDGNFPAHHPDPTVPENMRQLRDVVLRQKCDFGIAFDGDGDRIGAIDDTGEMVLGDKLLLIFAEDLLKRQPGATIIADVKTSRAILDEIAYMGGAPIMWKTGHSYIKTKMLQENALLAGEMSGHMFFAENYYGFDDALLAASKLVALLSESEKSLSQIISSFPKRYSSSEIRIECDEEQKYNIITGLQKQLYERQIQFNNLDGVRVNVPEGWWLIRASNTQNCLVIFAESTYKESLNKILDELCNYLQKFNLDIEGIRSLKRE